MIPAACLLMTLYFLFKINYLHYVLSYGLTKSLQSCNLMQSLPLYISCLFSMFFNDDIVDIEKPDGICSPTFVLQMVFQNYFYIH